MDWAVVLWSSGLVVLAVVNLLLWMRAARRLQILSPTLPDDFRRNRRLQLWLSAGYVFGCAFRSVVPVFDVPRVALIDSPLASVLVGRSVATLAELCFVAQWALILSAASRVTGSAFGRWSARTVLPLVFTAEICSWYSVLTTSNLGHAFEESLWALSAALMVASLLVAWPRWKPAHRPAVVTLGILGACYVAYMLWIDIPMYAGRWLEAEAAGTQYRTLSEGLLYIASPHAVSYATEVWRHEFVWMALYFSVGVWCSIALVHSPLPEYRPAPVERRSTSMPWLRPLRMPVGNRFIE